MAKKDEQPQFAKVTIPDTKLTAVNVTNTSFDCEFWHIRNPDGSRASIRFHAHEEHVITEEQEKSDEIRALVENRTLIVVRK